MLLSLMLALSKSNFGLKLSLIKKERKKFKKTQLRIVIALTHTSSEQIMKALIFC